MLWKRGCVLGLGLVVFCGLGLGGCGLGLRGCGLVTSLANAKGCYAFMQRDMQRLQCCELLLFQERRREFSLKSPGVKPQASSVSVRHNLVSSQQSISSVINGSSTSSLLGSTLSTRRRVPSNLPTTMNGSQLLSTVDDEMDVDSSSSGMSTPNTTTPTTTDTTDSELNADDDSSVFSAAVSSETSGFGSS